MPFVVVESLPNAAGGRTVEAWCWTPEMQCPARCQVDLDCKGVDFGDVLHFEGQEAVWWRPAGDNVTVRVRTLGVPYMLAPLPE